MISDLLEVLRADGKEGTDGNTPEISKSTSLA